MPNRRALNFQSLDDVIQDAQSLHQTGYIQLGQWDLSQICQHLTDWITYPIDGFPPLSLPERTGFWLLRHTIAGLILRRVLTKKALPIGTGTLKQSVHPPCDESLAIEKLQQAITRFQQFPGPFHPSPVFGQLNENQGPQLQLLHCAHHLSFLQPKPTPTPPL